MASFEVKQISSSYKTRMCVTLLFPSMKKKRQSVFAYMYLAHTAFCVSLWYGSVHMHILKNLWMPVTISWQLFAHFYLRKHAASVGLGFAQMNVSAGLSDAYATPSLLLPMFPCCESWQNISSRSCHSALWVALWLRICGQDPQIHVFSYTHAC